MLVFAYLEYGILRTEDNAVVTLEAHAAAHAAVGFGNCLLFGQAGHTLVEVTQNFV
jgi:hypothetical protein